MPTAVQLEYEVRNLIIPHDDRRKILRSGNRQIEEHRPFSKYSWIKNYIHPHNKGLGRPQLLNHTRKPFVQLTIHSPQSSKIEQNK